MRSAVILWRVPDGSVMTGIIHGAVVVNFAMPIVGPVLTSDVPHNLKITYHCTLRAKNLSRVFEN
jgi:hypothetical protein